MELEAIRAVTQRLRAEVHKVVVGQDAVLDLLLVALLSDGHALAAYWKGAREEVLRRLHGRGAPAADPDAALRRLLEARGKGGTLDVLEARVQALRARTLGVEDEAVRTALEIHRWREELTDGA